MKLKNLLIEVNELRCAIFKESSLFISHVYTIQYTYRCISYVTMDEKLIYINNDNNKNTPYRDQNWLTNLKQTKQNSIKVPNVLKSLIMISKLL